MRWWPSRSCSREGEGHGQVSAAEHHPRVRCDEAARPGQRARAAAAALATGYAALAARQEAFGPGRAEWIAALEADHENLRAALEFCLSESGQAAAGAQLACDLWRYWETHGHLTEGRRILAALLDRLDQASPARPRALWTAGFLAQFQGEVRGRQEAA